MGVIFHHSLGEELSRDALVVSVYAFGKKLPIGKDFLVTPKSRDFHEILTYLENDQEASRKLLGSLERDRSVLECTGSDFGMMKVEKNKSIF